MTVLATSTISILKVGIIVTVSLSHRQRKLINPSLKATAPVLKDHGTAITSTFYRILFDKYPDVKSYFNMSHQRTVDGKPVSKQVCGKLISAFMKPV